MLTISENAAEVIKMLLAGDDWPDNSGLRIAPAVEDQQDAGLQASIASEPESDDQVIEEGGVRVFLEPEAAQALGDKVLDAQQNDNGEIALAIRE